MQDSKFICTHHGHFHCDEALGVGMLKLLPEFSSLPLVRTRNMDDVAKAHIVLDVGGTYDAAARRFDHHQPEFQDAYSSEHNIRLSSAGLVFKHYGPAVVKCIMTLGGQTPDPTDDTVSLIVAKTYNSLISEVDAIDNGVDQYENVAGKARYRIHSDLGSRVKRLNPKWHEPQSEEAEMAAFRSAVKVTITELIEIVNGYAHDWLPARSLAQAALDQAETVHSSGEIIVLERFGPWESHLFDLEKERSIVGKVKYALFPDTRGGWRIKAVPVESGSFTNRKPLPKAWRGARDEELSTVTGIPGCVFVHAAGFIGGNSSKEGALAMAKAALEAEE